MSTFGIEFPGGQTVHRDRRELIADPYNAGRQIRAGDWGSTIELPGAYLDPTASSALGNASRAEILSSGRLFLDDPTLDVVAGDRIRVGGTLEDLDSGAPWYVQARPAGQTNPFTGDSPPLEIPLTLVEG